MPSIDYSKLHIPKKPSPHGHSVEGSFYLQKTKAIPGRYNPYYKHFTSSVTTMAVIDTEEASQPEDNKK